MSRKKIIDFPEIGNISTLDYYELLLSGKRATRFATKSSQSSLVESIQKSNPQKPSKKKGKKDKSSPYKRRKTDEVVPPSSPEEVVKLKYIYGCIWGEDSIGRKIYTEIDGVLKPGIIEGYDQVPGEDMLPVRYMVNGNWLDLREKKAYLTGENVEYQNSMCEVLWPFPPPVGYPQVDLLSKDSTISR